MEFEQIGRQDDGGEHIVEIVRNAVGQHSNAAHPLRMQKLLFEALLLRDIASNRHHTWSVFVRERIFRDRPKRPLVP